MRYWRVLVSPEGGRQFSARALEISASRVVLRGDHALPTGIPCDLQIIVPPPNDQQPPGIAGLQAEVDGVVFASRDIRLAFRVKSLSDEVRQLIDVYAVNPKQVNRV